MYIADTVIYYYY